MINPLAHPTKYCHKKKCWQCLRIELDHLQSVVNKLRAQLDNNKNKLLGPKEIEDLSVLPGFMDT